MVKNIRAERRAQLAVEARKYQANMKTLHPTPYPDVNETLSVLLTRVQQALGSEFLGMYLHGSLANGGFDKHSDIDVIVVTASDSSDESFSALKQMHAEIAQIDSPWAIQLEVSYIPKIALRRFDPLNNLHPHMDRGAGEELHWMYHECDWIIQRHILRECGIVITGPDPKSLVDPVTAEDIKQAVREGLALWLKPILKVPAEISKRGYQSFFVLSLCRMLYTLKYGEIIPKQDAAEWGRENLDPCWTPLIEHALIGRQHPNIDAAPEDINGTLEMMRYALQQVQPTPYAEVNQLLNLLLTNVKAILGNQFVGMYLYGSLSSGDFNPVTSDVDFLVVTEDRLSDEKVAALKAMHKQAWATSLKRAGELEGAYIPKGLIRRDNPNGIACPTVNEGKFYLDRPGSDWIIQRQVIRESGVVLDGPDPKTLIDPVHAEDIRQSVLGVLHEWWFPMLDSPSWLSNHGSAYHAFAVITMCRVLHALEYGTVVSKPKAVQWARSSLGYPWTQLIDKAIIASRHEETDEFLKETLDLIRFIQDKVRSQS